MVDTPFVISIIGLSSSGKTTLGRRLHQYLQEQGTQPLELIDGDSVREFLRGKIGYAAKDRKLSAAVQTQLAYMLYQHGISSIVCNISPFEESRAFARHKIPGLIEIHLDCALQTCIDRDRELDKNVYRPIVGGQNTDVNIVGVDIEFEEPARADLTLHTDIEGVDDSFARLLDHLAGRWQVVLTAPAIRETL